MRWKYKFSGLKMSDLTKRAIKTSFLKLLNAKMLDKITVKDIVEDCGINRNTFYYHFEDVYALLQEIFEDETKNYVIKHGQNLTDAFLDAIGFALENKRAVFHVFHSVKRELLEQYLFDVSDRLAEHFVNEQAEGLTVGKEDLRYVTVFYKHAVVGTIIEWLLKGMEAEPERVIKRMGEIFDGSVRQTLERIAEN